MVNSNKIFIILFILSVCLSSCHSSLSDKTSEVWHVADECEHDSNVSDGALCGVFSVSDTTKIRFSCGNLQYMPLTGEWRLARHQYESIGTSNFKINRAYNGWIDLFGWAASGKQSGALCYMPYESSPYDEDYIIGDSYANCLDGKFSYCDWGRNVICNGGDDTTRWRVLTSDEYDYLLRRRKKADNLFTRATVNGIHGFVVLPDNWDDLYPSVLVRGATSWGANNLTDDEWQHLEKNGAVMFPVTGFRENQRVKNVTSSGFYWSSTASSPICSKSFRFSDETFQTGAEYARHYGLAVRLVCAE